MTYCWYSCSLVFSKMILKRFLLKHQREQVREMISQHGAWTHRISLHQNGQKYLKYLLFKSDIWEIHSKTLVHYQIFNPISMGTFVASSLRREGSTKNAVYVLRKAQLSYSDTHKEKTPAREYFTKT